MKTLKLLLLPSLFFLFSEASAFEANKLPAELLYPPDVTDNEYDSIMSGGIRGVEPSVDKLKSNSLPNYAKPTVGQVLKIRLNDPEDYISGGDLDGDAWQDPIGRWVCVNESPFDTVEFLRNRYDTLTSWPTVVNAEFSDLIMRGRRSISFLDNGTYDNKSREFSYTVTASTLNCKSIGFKFNEQSYTNSADLFIPHINIEGSLHTTLPSMDELNSLIPTSGYYKSWKPWYKINYIVPDYVYSVLPNENRGSDTIVGFYHENPVIVEDYRYTIHIRAISNGLLQTGVIHPTDYVKNTRYRIPNFTNTLYFFELGSNSGDWDGRLNLIAPTEYETLFEIAPFWNDTQIGPWVKNGNYGAPKVENLILSGQLIEGGNLTASYDFIPGVNQLEGGINQSIYSFGVKGETAALVLNSTELAGAQETLKVGENSFQLPTLTSEHINTVIEVSVMAKDGEGTLGNILTVDTSMALVEGNHTTHAFYAVQPLAISGTIALPQYPVDIGFPHNGLLSAQFKLLLSNGGDPNNYEFSANQSWVDVTTVPGTVRFIGTKRGNGAPEESERTVEIIAKHKTTEQRFSYTFTLKRWFLHNQLKNDLDLSKSPSELADQIDDACRKSEGGTGWRGYDERYIEYTGLTEIGERTLFDEWELDKFSSISNSKFERVGKNIIFVNSQSSNSYATVASPYLVATKARDRIQVYNNNNFRVQYPEVLPSTTARGVGCMREYDNIGGKTMPMVSDLSIAGDIGINQVLTVNYTFTADTSDEMPINRSLYAKTKSKEMQVAILTARDLAGNIETMRVGENSFDLPPLTRDDVNSSYSIGIQARDGRGIYGNVESIRVPLVMSPSISELKIGGNIRENARLTATYTFTPATDDTNPQNRSIYALGLYGKSNALAVANHELAGDESTMQLGENSFVLPQLTSEYINSVFEVSVIAVDGRGKYGNSLKVKIDQPNQPSIDGLVLTGIAQEGQSLQGYYHFKGAQGDSVPENRSVYAFGRQGETSEMVLNSDLLAGNEGTMTVGYNKFDLPPLSSEQIGEVFELTVRSKDGRGVYGNQLTELHRVTPIINDLTLKGQLKAGSTLESTYNFIPANMDTNSSVNKSVYSFGFKGETASKVVDSSELAGRVETMGTGQNQFTVITLDEQHVNKILELSVMAKDGDNRQGNIVTIDTSMTYEQGDHTSEILVALHPILLNNEALEYLQPLNTGYPTTGYLGARIRFKLSNSGDPSEFEFTASQPWVDVKTNPGIIDFIGTKIGNGAPEASDRNVIIKAKHKTSGDTWEYEFSLDRWYIHNQKTENGFNNKTEHSEIAKRLDQACLLEGDDWKVMVPKYIQKNGLKNLGNQKTLLDEWYLESHLPGDIDDPWKHYRNYLGKAVVYSSANYRAIGDIYLYPNETQDVIFVADDILNILDKPNSWGTNGVLMTTGVNFQGVGCIKHYVPEPTSL